MFDKLKVQSLLFMNAATLSLFSTGATTGFVTELGHGTSTVIPVY
jgi:actin-related protein